MVKRTVFDTKVTLTVNREKRLIGWRIIKTFFYICVCVYIYTYIQNIQNLVTNKMESNHKNIQFMTLQVANMVERLFLQNRWNGMTFFLSFIAASRVWQSYQTKSIHKRTHIQWHKSVLEIKTLIGKII